MFEGLFKVKKAMREERLRIEKEERLRIKKEERKARELRVMEKFQKAYNFNEYGDAQCILKNMIQSMVNGPDDWVASMVAGNMFLDYKKESKTYIVIYDNYCTTLQRVYNSASIHVEEAVFKLNHDSANKLRRIYIEKLENAKNNARENALKQWGCVHEH